MTSDFPAESSAKRNAAPMVLLEAEQFRSLGGWVIDQQFMAKVGSPYLLAHGLGEPVADAVTSVRIPVPGRYRVWVRTFDWVAPWSAPGTPGRFQLLVNGKALAATFGTVGAAWHWHDGGTVDLPDGVTNVALHDLTGFEGRCDAVLMAGDLEYLPPDSPAGLMAFRGQLSGRPAVPEEKGAFDLVVVGGGIAGVCAATTAARLGLRVALVQDRPVIGGNSSFEVAVNPAGETHIDPYPRIGDVVREFEPNHCLLGPQPECIHQIRSHDPRTQRVAAEPGLELLTGWRVLATETAAGAITAVVAQAIVSARRIRIVGRWFADCTGDGDVGALAGAEHDTTLTGHMGPTNLWRTSDTGTPAHFPECAWALDLSDKPFPGRGEHTAQGTAPGLDSLGQWFWESGFDLHPINDIERVRDTNFRAMYGAWHTLKNLDGRYPNHKLAWAAYITGKRESRRLFGDVIVNRGDLLRATVFADACVPCTWHMDLHVPHRDYGKGFEGEEFISWFVEGPFPRPFWLPYRALYSRNVANLFMAGRDVSVTHEALGTVRVMRTCGMMGEVVGMAASLCRRFDTTPRGVYERYMHELKTLMRAGLPRQPGG